MTLKNFDVLAVDYGPWETGDNPEVLKMNGVELAILKSSTGTREDARFASHVRKAAEAEMQWAIYHWADPNIPAFRQANKVQDIIAKYAKFGKPVFIAIDAEQNWKSWAEWLKWIRGEKLSFAKFGKNELSVFFMLITEEFRKRWPNVVVYTRASFINDSCPAYGPWLGKNDVPLWLAHYQNQPRKRVKVSWDDVRGKFWPQYPPALPRGCRAGQVVGHQFTGDRLIVPGLKNPADINTFSRKWLDELRPAEFPQQETAAVETVPEVPARNTDKNSGCDVAIAEASGAPGLFTAQVKVRMVNVRERPSTAAPVVGQLEWGAPINVHDIVWDKNGVWLQTDAGWVAAVWHGMVLVEKVENSGAIVL